MAPEFPLLDWLAAAVAQVGRASVDGAVFAFGVLIVTRTMTSLPAALRAALWWMVTARFLLGLVWVSPITVPVLPAESSGMASRVVVASRDSSPGAVAAPGPAEGLRRADESSIKRLASAATVHVPSILGGAWLAFLGVLLALRLHALSRTARLLARARDVDGRVRALASDAAARLGLLQPTRVRVVDADVPPQVLWLGPATVLLPRTLVEHLSDHELWLVLCHELAHVRRRDGAWAIVPALTSLAFAFHPFARLAVREYSVARESACDAAVLDCADASPRDYGRLLVRLGVSRRHAAACAGTPTSVSALKRRLIMLQRWTPTARRFTGRAALVFALAMLAMVPMQLVARRAAADRVPGVEAERRSPAAAAEPADTPGIEFTIDSDDAQVPPPEPPAPPEPPSPPPPPPPPPSHGHLVGHAGASGDGWAFVTSDHETMIHGSSSDPRIKALRGSAPVFWFVRDGREYVIRDKATLAEIERTLKGVQELDSQQAALGAQQADLGARQAAIGASQASEAARHAARAVREARRAMEGARHAHASSPAHQAELEHAAQQVEAAQRELEQQVRHQVEALAVPQAETSAASEAELKEHQEQLHKRQEELGARQAEFARQQEALAKRMDAAHAKMETDLRAVIEKALASGTATPLKQQ